jgi:hypothetical protein
MRFRLITIAYAFALVAAGMTLFGVWGIAAAAGLLLYWIWVLRAKSGLEGLYRSIAGAFAIAAILLLSLVAFEEGREAVRRQLCIVNLKELTSAVLDYRKPQSPLPAAISRDVDGHELHSWRTTVLPILVQEPWVQNIAKHEPWNSAKNSRVFAGKAPDVYHCPSDDRPSSETSYFAIVGDHAAWLPDRGRQLSELSDGTSTTILLLEAPVKNVRWNEPIDLSFDEAVAFLSQPPERRTGHMVDNGFFWKPSWSVLAAFADGHLQALRLPVPVEQAKALLTIDGGERIDEDKLRQLSEADLDYERCFTCGVLLLLAVLPGIRLVWLKVRAREVAAPAGH